MKYELLSDSTSVVTGAIAIANIQEILYVIVLVLSVANILFNMGYRIYKHIKEKNYEKIGDELKDASEKVENLRRKEDDKDE